MPKLREVAVSTQLKDRLVQGHPWVYRNHVTAAGLESGEWVRVRCGGWTGYGLWDNRSPIALRIFSQQQLPDPRWLRQQIESAWELRSPLRQRDCTAYRWLFGEGDGLPGITVDLYGRFAVVQTYMEGATGLLDWLVKGLTATAPLEGILWRSQHQAEPGEMRQAAEVTEGPSVPASKTQLLWGTAPPEDLVVREYGLQFQVNLATGQKTGLFLDHRENRHFVESLSQGRSLLNCFAYTGAFSLYALRGGASHVTSVDIGKGLAAAADRNVQLNQLEGDRHQFITGDCFTVLQQYIQSGQTFDVVVLDPPSFAKTKQNRFAAIRAYAKLNALALQCVAPKGFLVSASCTSQVSPEAFKEMLATASTLSVGGEQAAGTKRKPPHHRLQIIHEAGHPPDHPVPPQFPEGRYLKFVVARVSGQP